MTGEQRLFTHQLECLRGSRPPMKLTTGQSEAQAVRLREAGMSYPSIEVAMRVYHGVERSAHAWQWLCRSRGVAASKGPNA